MSLACLSQRRAAVVLQSCSCQCTYDFFGTIFWVGDWQNATQCHHHSPRYLDPLRSYVPKAPGAFEVDAELAAENEAAPISAGLDSVF